MNKLYLQYSFIRLSVQGTNRKATSIFSWDIFSENQKITLEKFIIEFVSIFVQILFT